MERKAVSGLIRVTRVPAGDPPLIVREAWVGVILHCYPTVGPDPDRAENALGGKVVGDNPSGVYVPQDLAIAAVGVMRPYAAAWWRENGFPRKDKNFCFALADVEIISGVTTPPRGVSSNVATPDFRARAKR